jgi:hypothetical protein
LSLKGSLARRSLKWRRGAAAESSFVEKFGFARARDLSPSARVVWHREEEIDPIQDQWSGIKNQKYFWRLTPAICYLKSPFWDQHQKSAIRLPWCLASECLIPETSAKLDRLAVGSILWSKLVFHIQDSVVSNQQSENCWSRAPSLEHQCLVRDL